MMTRNLLRFSIAVLAIFSSGCSSSPDDKIASRLGIKREEVRAMHARKSLSDDALMRIDPGELRGILRELGPPDLPQRRAAFLQLRLRAPGATPTGVNLLNSIQRMRQFRAVPGKFPPAKAGTSGHAGAMGGAMMAGGGLPVAGSGPTPDRSRWVSLGPSNIGGRTRAILVDPTHPDRIWAANVGAGVWRSDDAGMTFAPIDDFMENLAVCCLAMDPKHPDIIYAGTGEGFYNIDAIRGAGIFRLSPSTNKWEQLDGTGIPQMEFLTRLVFSSDGSVLLASGGANGQNGVGGIFRSEDPGHKKWDQTHASDMACVQFHPADHLRAVAGGGWYSGEAWWSDDSGKTWNQATHAGNWVVDPMAQAGSPGSEKGRVELTYALKNPSIVYALVDTAGGQIWKSTDGGKSYALVPTVKGDASILGGQGWYDNVIWAGDPSNENFILLGGVNLWRSFDGGLNLIDISDWENPQSVHADQHVIVADAGFKLNKTVYFGNDGGIYKASDATVAGDDRSRTHGWAPLNETYGTTQFYGVAVSPINGMIVAGAQDNGTLQLIKGSGACAWRVMSSGDGGHCFAHPGDRNYFYGEYVNLDLIRSRDGGYTAEDISGLTGWDAYGRPVCKAPQYTLPDACASPAKSNFYAPLALDMRNPKRILAGGTSLWVTVNADAPVTESTGPAWRPIRGPLALRPGEYAIDAWISSISISPWDANVVWIGYNNGRIFRTAHASAAVPDWSEVVQDGADPLPAGRMSTGIVFDRVNPQIVYLTYAGIATKNLWRSSDGGTKWESLWHTSSGDLPAMPVFSLTMHPKNPQILYMGTEFGLFWSSNGGHDWSSRGDGPTNCPVQDVTWYGQTLIVATHGRGIFQIDLTIP